ncbi:MAG: hypothetical protein NZM00_05600 [Anaerolinea sp.]|nr:hypothetical protein [Anaerolinea sp.]
MSAQVAWLYRDRIIHQQFYGDMTADDITYVTETTQPLMAAGTAPIHTLVDARFIRKYPTNLNALRKAVTTPASDKLGWVIMINNGNPVLKFLSAVMAQVTIVNVRMRIFETVDQALRFLLSMDSSLGEDVLTIVVPDAPPIPDEHV